MHTDRLVLSRRALLGATVLGAGLAATGCDNNAPAGATAPLRVQLSWLKTVTFVGFFLADHNGWYRDEKVNVSLFAGGPNLPDVASVVAARAADVALLDVSTLVKANAQGAGLVLIGAVFQRSPGGFVSLAKNPVRRPEDFVGKRVGLPPGSEVLMNAILAVNKLPQRYTKVAIGGDPQPLVDGACDVMACYVTAQPLTLADRAMQAVSVTQSELGVPDYGLGLAVRRQTLRDRRHDLVGLVRATIKGYELNTTDPDAGARLSVDEYGKGQGLSLSEQQAENRVQIPLMSSDVTAAKGLGWISADQISGPVYAGLRAAGVTALPAVSTLMDTSVLEEAYGGRTWLLTPPSPAPSGSAPSASTR